MIAERLLFIKTINKIERVSHFVVSKDLMIPSPVDSFLFSFPQLTVLQALLLSDEFSQTSFFSETLEAANKEKIHKSKIIDIEENEAAFCEAVFVTLLQALSRPAPDNAVDLLLTGIAGFTAFATKIEKDIKNNIRDLVDAFCQLRAKCLSLHEKEISKLEVQSSEGLYLAPLSREGYLLYSKPNLKFEIFSTVRVDELNQQITVYRLASSTASPSLGVNYLNHQLSTNSGSSLVLTDAAGQPLDPRSTLAACPTSTTTISRAAPLLPYTTTSTTEPGALVHLVFDRLARGLVLADPNYPTGQGQPLFAHGQPRSRKTRNVHIGFGTATMETEPEQSPLEAVSVGCVVDGRCTLAEVLEFVQRTLNRKLKFAPGFACSLKSCDDKLTVEELIRRFDPFMPGKTFYLDQLASIQLECYSSTKTVQAGNAYPFMATPGQQQATSDKIEQRLPHYEDIQAIYFQLTHEQVAKSVTQVSCYLNNSWLDMLLSNVEDSSLPLASVLPTTAPRLLAVDLSGRTGSQLPADLLASPPDAWPLAACCYKLSAVISRELGRSRLLTSAGTGPGLEAYTELVPLGGEGAKKDIESAGKTGSFILYELVPDNHLD